MANVIHVVQNIYGAIQRGQAEPQGPECGADVLVAQQKSRCRVRESRPNVGWMFAC
jgi:hypothetical protein